MEKTIRRHNREDRQLLPNHITSLWPKFIEKKDALFVKALENLEHYPDVLKKMNLIGYRTGMLKGLYAQKSFDVIFSKAKEKILTPEEAEYVEQIRLTV